MKEDAPNSTLHPTHLPAMVPPTPLRSGGETAAAKWAGECGVMRGKRKNYE
jgi:hypothetical protein